MVRGSFTCRHVHSTITGLQHGYFPRGGRFDSASAVQRLFVVLSGSATQSKNWAKEKQSVRHRSQSFTWTTSRSTAVLYLSLTCTGLYVVIHKPETKVCITSCFKPSVTFACTVNFIFPSLIHTGKLRRCIDERRRR